MKDSQRFRQGVPRLRLFIERGTESVPDDGQYYVLLAGKIVFHSRQEGPALERYRELRDARLGRDSARRAKPDPREALRRVKSESELQAFREAGVRAAHRAQKWRARRGGVRG